MKAIRLHSPGGLENLAYEEVETPTPGDAEALVRVHAAAITRDELEWPVDRLPAIPSYELSGTVVEIGDGVTGVRLGEAVYALTDFDQDGVAAEYAAVAAQRLASMPEMLSHVEAAAIPLPALSAMQGLFDHGHLEQGQRVLIHGGAGGVGAFAVQLARVRGAYVIATASSSRIEAARDLGAHEVIDHRSADFTTIEPVNLVFDTVGGDRLIGSVSVVARGGLVVSVAETPPAGLGEGQGVETRFFIVEPNAGQLAELATLADEGRLRVLVDGTFPLDRAREAFERSQSGETRGKVILEIVDDRPL
jgi:NADPH:quinone reductase-like Zn-dependent oxidoreductase